MSEIGTSEIEEPGELPGIRAAMRPCWQGCAPGSTSVSPRSPRSNGWGTLESRGVSENYGRLCAEIQDLPAEVARLQSAVDGLAGRLRAVHDLASGGVSGTEESGDRRSSETTWNLGPTSSLRARTATNPYAQVFRLHEQWDELYTSAEHDCDVTRLGTTETWSKAFAQQKKGTAGRQSVSQLGPSGLQAGLLKNVSVFNPVLYRFQLFSLFSELCCPHSKPRITWDVAGLFLLLFDVAVIPYLAAWDVKPIRGDPLWVESVFVTCFWCVDMVLAFMTSFYRDGSLVSDRHKIMLHYLKTWFVPDSLCVSVDVVVLLSEDSREVRTVTFLRGMRFIRMLRLLRLAKLSKLSETVGDVLSAPAHQWVVLVIALMKVFLSMFAGAHLMACAWYATGMQARANGQESWLDFVNFHDSAFTYIQALHWVLAHITAAPVEVFPKNPIEYIFNITVIIFSMVMLGTCVSKMTGTIQQLSTWRKDSVEKMRQLQRYLARTEVPMEMCARIMRFADNDLRRVDARKAEANILNILSTQLRTELLVFERGDCVATYPLFAVIKVGQAEVFNEICSRFTTCCYEEEEVIFAAGTSAQCMYVTVCGAFRLKTRPTLQNSAGKDVVVSCSPQTAQYFADICLFSQLLHKASLVAETWGEVITLSSTDFMEAVKKSPICIGLSREYALALFENFVEDAFVDRRNSKDLLQHLSSDYVPREFGERACDSTTLAKKREEEERVLLLGRKSVHKFALWIQNQHEDARRGSLHSTDSSDDNGPVEGGQPQGECTVCRYGADFVRFALSQESIGSTVLGELPSAFPELDERSGVYAKVSQMDERSRAIAGMLSVFWLVGGHYEEFVEGQDPHRRMTKDMWHELQDCDLWRGVDEETLDAVLVFLLLRGLGKSKAFASLLPVEQQGSPELIVETAITELGHILPSAQRLDAQKRNLVMSLLHIHSKFNFAQLLQGENLPSNIETLRMAIEEKGQEVLSLYLFALTAMMCGLVGSKSLQGSLFMDQVNGCNVVLAIQSLQQVQRWGAQRVYWTYIRSRADRLGVSVSSSDPEQLAFARLLCLNRASTEMDLQQLQDAWHSLDRADRAMLSNCFLADGLKDRAYVFVYLPAYFANARNNPAVGVILALNILVDVVELLLIGGCFDLNSDDIMTAKVDLLELANFAIEVRVRHVFEVCISYSKLIRQEEAVETHAKLVMTAQNWSRVQSAAAADLRAVDVAHMVRQVSKRQMALQASLSSLTQVMQRQGGPASHSRGSLVRLSSRAPPPSKGRASSNRVSIHNIKPLVPATSVLGTGQPADGVSRAGRARRAMVRAKSAPAGARSQNHEALEADDIKLQEDIRSDGEPVIVQRSST